MAATSKSSTKDNKKSKVATKKVSKSWLAFEKYLGNGVIHDMKAVFK